MFDSRDVIKLMRGVIRGDFELPPWPKFTIEARHQKRLFDPARAERKPKDWEQRTNTKRFRKGK